MLRCPPSRIHLTSSDLAGLDHRLAARQSARIPRPQTSSVRLSPGPGRPTRLCVVPAEQNVGRRRAVSSSSEAAFHDDNDAVVEPDVTCDAPNISVSTCDDAKALNAHQHSPGHASLCVNAATALENVLKQQSSPTRPSPRRQVDSFYGTEAVNVADQQQDSRSPSTRILDGTAELQADQATIRTPLVAPPTHAGNRVLADVRDVYQAQRPPQYEPRPFSSARARRRHARSQDVQMYRDPDDLQDFIYARHMAAPLLTNRQAAVAPPIIPELCVPSEILVPPANPALDPGAPVFIPRTRFGSATGSSAEAGVVAVLEPQWSSVDSSHSTTNLRLRSLSDQNVDRTFRQRSVTTREIIESTLHTDPNHTDNRWPEERRRRSRTSDQNAAIRPSGPNLERYPLLRPAAHTRQRRVSSLRGPAPHQISPDPIPLLSYSLHSYTQARAVSSTHGQAHLQVRHTFVPAGEAGELAAIRSVSPAVSTSSRSTPNLLHRPLSPSRIYSRGSSLSWSRAKPGASKTNRIPSMVSAADGISSSSAVGSRSPSKEGLDAATEFLRMRNSPLDDLTERFSRLAANRPRSVGRSFERPPRSRTRVSLLNGDPFRQDHVPTSAHSTPIPSSASVQPSQPSSERRQITAEEFAALTLGIPPSSPLPPLPTLPALPSSSSMLSSTSPADQLASLNLTSSPSGRLPNNALASPDSGIKRKPVPQTLATPRVEVYDDSKPPYMQPQTPADVRRSRRRTKTHSQSTDEHCAPVLAAGVTTRSPPAIPDRHPHRNTYPSHTSAEHTVAGPSATDSVSRSTRRVNTRRRANTQRSSAEAENDEVGGHLQGLEEDRRIWMSRREGGTLDSTPPREGKFERYLS